MATVEIKKVVGEFDPAHTALVYDPNTQGFRLPKKCEIPPAQPFSTAASISMQVGQTALLSQLTEQE